jgi:CBS domain containing-hemolysin-like protein
VSLALLVAALVVTLLAGTLRAGTASLVRTPRADALHDAAEGFPGAAKVAELLEDREAIVPSVNIVHSILLVFASLAGAAGIAGLVSGAAVAVSFLLLGVMLVLVTDLVPRIVGRARPRVLAYRLAAILERAVHVGIRAVDILREEELEEDADERGDDHDDDADEIELISSVLEFSETLVREVMVPRPDMIVVDVGADLGELMRVVDEHGFSRIPVVGEGVDDVVGLLITKDLLPRLANGDRPATVGDLMRPIDFVPETKRVSDLLREMQASKAHMAVVVDEYGGTAGLVTIEDLLEELVGEIVDEYDEDELLVEAAGDGTWLVDGRLPVSDLSEIASVELPDEDWDTVGGLVLGLAGRVPFEGERFEVAGLVLTVVRVQGRRVAEVRVEHVAPAAPVEEAG